MRRSLLRNIVAPNNNNNNNTLFCLITVLTGIVSLPHMKVNTNSSAVHPKESLSAVAVGDLLTLKFINVTIKLMHLISVFIIIRLGTFSKETWHVNKFFSNMYSVHIHNDFSLFPHTGCQFIITFYHLFLLASFIRKYKQSII